MPLIQTKTFQLSANILVNEQAEKLALLLPGRLDTKDYAHLASSIISPDINQRSNIKLP